MRKVNHRSGLINIHCCSVIKQKTSSTETQLYNSSTLREYLVLFLLPNLTFGHAGECEQGDRIMLEAEMTWRQKRLLSAPLRPFVYLHDRHTEVGIDEGCGPTCLDRAELWKRHSFRPMLCSYAPVMISHSVCNTVFQVLKNSQHFL